MSVICFLIPFAVVLLMDSLPNLDVARIENAFTSSANVAAQNEFQTHEIQSPYQSGKTTIRVLLPDSMDNKKRYRVVYVLPVEAGNSSRFGDGMNEIRRHNLHNKYQTIFVSPEFSKTPWYGDHPTIPQLKQESHFLKIVIPFVETKYSIGKERKQKFLLGFSKSGAGAFSLLLRHPDLFQRALAFDAPLMRERLKKGKEVFDTQANFENYSVPVLLRKQGTKLGKEERLILLGEGFLNKNHEQLHALLNELDIPHIYRQGTERRHSWDSGWIPEAGKILLSSK